MTSLKNCSLFVKEYAFTHLLISHKTYSLEILRGRSGCDHMVIGFTTTYAISAITTNVVSWNSARRSVLDTTLCDKVCQCLVTGWWFPPGSLVFSTNKTDRHNITEILLKVELNTLTLEILLYI